MYKSIPFFLLTGESNSGGLGVNAQLTTAELATRNSVQILNNTSLVFQSLLIGTNNLIGHTGLTNNATHGAENGIANSFDEGRWPSNLGYMVKTGQGGSTVSKWQIGDGSGYWSTFVTRVSTAIPLVKAAGYSPRFFVFISLGINDAIGATNLTTYKNNFQTFISNIRAQLGNCIIGFTQLPAAYSAYSPENNGLATGSDFLISTADLWMGVNAQHWDHVGQRAMGSRAVDGWMNATGASAVGSVAASPVAGSYGSPQTVSLSTPTAGASIYYTTDLYKMTGEDASANYGTLYSAPISVDIAKTIKAKAVKAGFQSAKASLDYVIGTAPTVVTWGSMTNASQSGDYIVNNGSISGGAGGVGNALDATLPFEVHADWPADFPVEGAVVYLSADNGTNFNWNGTNTFLCGSYLFQYLIESTTVGGSNSNRGSVTVPLQMRMKKSGNDVLLDTSNDGGDTWTNRFTFSGVLAGQTAIYIKALFAIADTLKKIRVTFIQ